MGFVRTTAGLSIGIMVGVTAVFGDVSKPENDWVCLLSDNIMLNTETGEEITQIEEIENIPLPIYGAYECKGVDQEGNLIHTSSFIP